MTPKNNDSHSPSEQARLEGASREVVAWAAQNYRTGKFHYIWHTEEDVQGWIRLQHQSQDNETYQLVPLCRYDAPAQPDQQQGQGHLAGGAQAADTRLTAHDQAIIRDLEVMAADVNNGFWPQALAIGALRIIKNQAGGKP